MFALANVVHLLPDKFSCLRGGRFAFARIFLCPLQCLFFRHGPPSDFDRRSMIEFDHVGCESQIFIVKGSAPWERMSRLRIQGSVTWKPYPIAASEGGVNVFPRKVPS
jgi:hypothetical protein